MSCKILINFFSAFFFSNLLYEDKNKVRNRDGNVSYVKGGGKKIFFKLV